MTSVLYVKSSILGEHSATNAVVDALHAHWAQKHAGASHVVRNLGAEALPHLDMATLGAMRAESAEAQAGAANGLKVLQELISADTLVLAAPMYNFGIPSGLKAWLDHVIHPGKTFQYGANGPEGLLKGKKAILVLATGGAYTEGPAKAMDFVEPYLRTVLGFIGITDVTVVRAEAQAMGEAGAASKAKALATVAAL
jgi:FMN-dependent NADH-azoreductase